MMTTHKPAEANKAARGRDDERMITTPAIHHVGGTLESDPKYVGSDREGEGLPGEGITPHSDIGSDNGTPMQHRGE